MWKSSSSQYSSFAWVIHAWVVTSAELNCCSLHSSASCERRYGQLCHPCSVELWQYLHRPWRFRPFPYHFLDLFIQRLRWHDRRCFRHSTSRSRSMSHCYRSMIFYHHAAISSAAATPAFFRPRAPLRTTVFSARS